MSNHENDFDSKDFTVQHGLSESSPNVFKIYSDLKSKCKATSLKGRLQPGEDINSYLLKVAVSSTSDCGTLFRKTETSNDALILIWLSIIKQRAQDACLYNDIKYNTPLTDSTLREFTKLNQQPHSIKDLANILAKEYGIILIVEKYFPTMKLDGCAFKLINGTPVIGISARYNRYDNFWFTLTHELAHIVLHYDYLNSPILDNFDSESSQDIEVEANRLATDSLIPRNILRKMLLNKDNLGRILELSSQAECHPAISAGIIRHRTNQWSLYSDLVNFMDVRSELGIND